ncbi:protein of unknown function [Taphrina deformans PYCC 5710]|uniref:Nudix hydrolase domain-containing protein n=1 Tax=Taphrina deformans (strain PYCC 5710 / ATCC 11124 / CBS 356.35 / IMI 108563 / JCM 9778 / NBRC 8474) TaxID=1097556 RepID=R4XI95_TAPDE|nr:protein of unknown function [Taphrina deformans PYCC 5710]|eukprot:CCG84214.1 protein of unknown function [Taphrina deformans PYCC 5710]
MSTIDEMLSRLRNVKPALPKNLPDSMRYAAVLCLMYPTSSISPSLRTKGSSDKEPEDLNVILTLRSSSMRSHAGDVSFPGGRQDEGEDNWATALREANEEIGFPYDYGPGLERICEMPHYLSKNNLLVTPCLAYSAVDPYEHGWRPEASVDEVQEIFSIRLSDISRGEGYDGRWMAWYALSWRLHQFFLPGTPYPFSSAEKKRIWGLTARMLVDISRIAFDRAPEYEFEDEVGDKRRIMKALEEGTFGKLGRQEKERAEATGEGQIVVVLCTA